MQQHEKSVLCRSKHGFLSVLHHGLAYAFTFKNIDLLLEPDEIDVFRHTLERIEEREWFRWPEGMFTLLPIGRLNASFYLTQAEVEEMKKLLQEASAMVKVHQRLFNRVR